MMSASTQTLPVEVDQLMMQGAPVPRPVLPGQTNPRDNHYGYSAGEHELTVRARVCGYPSILPGMLVPLRMFKKHVPNDTMDALAEEHLERVPANRELEVTPLDAADALMSRYQHRGFRILRPFTGMNGEAGVMRALKMFRIVHPPMPCKHRPQDSKGFKALRAHDQKILSRHCVACRLDDLRSDASIDRIAASNPSQKQTIEYGRDGDDVVLISEEQALLYVHEIILSALEQHHEHMMATLQQSKADVEAGRTGPGKKKFDNRDEWYFLMTHKSPNDIEAVETMARTQGAAMADTLGAQVSAAIERAANSKSISIEDVQQLLKQNEADLEKRIEARLRKELAEKKPKAAKGNEQIPDA